MTHSGTIDTADAQEPLVSNRFLLKSLVFLTAMALSTGALVLGGNWLGKRITLAGHTDSQETILLNIGRDRLALPANVIRFETQRRSGTAERADLYLLWPRMEGFSRAASASFNDLKNSSNLVFVQVTQSVMSRDMTGRVGPIYSHYFKGDAIDAGNGLSLHHFSPEAGYDQDVLLTGKTASGQDYAVRCVLPATPAEATSGDCQRDVMAGNDLSVLYRFSSNLLPQWEQLDAAVTTYIGAHLAKIADRKA